MDFLSLMITCDACILVAIFIILCDIQNTRSHTDSWLNPKHGKILYASVLCGSFLLAATSGYLFYVWGEVGGADSVPISYYVLTGISAVVRSLVPLIQRKAGIIYAKGVCVCAIQFYFAAMCISFPWIIFSTNLWYCAPHAVGTIFLLSYDFSFYVITDSSQSQPSELSELLPKE